MTLKELKPQLLALSLIEKAQAIQILAASLSNGWVGIEKTPSVMGIVCTEDLNRQRLANRIHEEIVAEASLLGKLIRVNRPPPERSG